MRPAPAALPSPPRSRHPRRLAALLAALLAASLLLGLPALGEPARAADGGLVVIAQTTYDVLPAEGRVHVTIEAEATSFEPNTPDAEVFYSGVTFAVQPGATNAVAFGEGQQLETSVVEATDSYSAIDVTFSRGVFFEESYGYTVEYDMVDPGGEPGRDLRIGSSLVAFSVWAFGTENEPGGSVSVSLPAGYTLDVHGTHMDRSDGANGQILLSAQPANPFAFFAYVTADRPGAFEDTELTVSIGGVSAPIVVHAWEDDPDWGTRIASLMTDGLPALADLIGVEYGASGVLSVEEAATSRLGEYAGIYDPLTGVIRVRYDADALVALHEAAHVWFNGALLDSRWINEAWAEFYAVTAAERLGESGASYELTDDLLEARIPLNDWGEIGAESLGVEDFGYAASYEVAGRVAARTDLDALQEVWRAASSGEMAYQPIHGGAAAPAPAGVEAWQRLLDLLEERTGARYADVWTEWIVNEQEAPLLEARETARRRYGSVVAEAAEWELPAVIRGELETWDFAAAVVHLDQASDILGDRERIETRAERLALDPPDTLRVAFEGEVGLQAAADVAVIELEALDAIGTATERLDREPTPLEAIGLIGSDPSLELSEARTAYEAGDAAAATVAAEEAAALRNGAVGSGTDRAVLASTAVLGLDGLLLVVASALRLRRMRPAHLPPAG
jgi:hypothetical protein